MYNPSKPEPKLNNPTQRANDLNDPQFENQQGYFPYDLTHNEFLTTRFGEVTPTCNMHTIPGDRVVFKGSEKTVLTRIQGNFLGTVNEYSDSFFVPTRSLFPNNYEKLIPNPTKGDDLPISALPKFPLGDFVHSYLFGPNEVFIVDSDGVSQSHALSTLMSFNTEGNNESRDVVLTRWVALLTMFSRGQLLDSLGYTLDLDIQADIDAFFEALYNSKPSNVTTIDLMYPPVGDTFSDENREIAITRPFSNPSEFRDAISYALEHAYIIRFDYLDLQEVLQILTTISSSLEYFFTFGNSLYDNEFDSNITNVDSGSVAIDDRRSFINLSTVLAYQQVIAQYYSNDTVDNIFTADLYMQNLRSVMFPSDSNVSAEPVFMYNGVETRYDLISCGAALFSLVSIDMPGAFVMRQYRFITLLFLLRNSLRYGDYFSTARPNMLAVGDLQINVENAAVSPIDITQNLLKQRFLNAANYIGSGFLPYMASIFGVTPSDTGTYPRFISHYKQSLRSDITTNTANDQGAQTTNLLGWSDGNSWDCFIDDYGVILVLKSYDLLPVYTQGVDNTFMFADRFDYFNPMLQNMGDQPILQSEFGGNYDSVFGYTMRNAEYKYKVSRAHGGFIGWLKGTYLPFPVDYYKDLSGNIKIDPDFIRDRPIFMDPVVYQMSGTSPCSYFHFVVSVVNQLQTARKMQATPPVLF